MKINDAEEIIRKIETEYRNDALKVDHIDGLSMEFDEWRFNIIMSNAEPLIRLNVESRGNKEIMLVKKSCY